MEGSVSFIDGNVVNLYIIYTLDSRSRDLNTDFTLGNCLKLTMDNDLNIDITIIVLDSMHVHNFCRQTVAGVKILFFFGVDDSFSVHVYNTRGYLSSRWRSDTRISWYYDNRIK